MVYLRNHGGWYHYVTNKLTQFTLDSLRKEIKDKTGVNQSTEKSYLKMERKKKQGGKILRNKIERRTLGERELKRGGWKNRKYFKEQNSTNQNAA